MATTKHIINVCRLATARSLISAPRWILKPYATGVRAILRHPSRLVSSGHVNIIRDWSLESKTCTTVATCQRASRIVASCVHDIYINSTLLDFLGQFGLRRHVQYASANWMDCSSSQWCNAQLDRRRITYSFSIMLDLVHSDSFDRLLQTSQKAKANKRPSMAKTSHNYA